MVSCFFWTHSVDFYRQREAQLTQRNQLSRRGAVVKRKATAWMFLRFKTRRVKTRGRHRQRAVCGIFAYIETVSPPSHQLSPGM